MADPDRGSLLRRAVEGALDATVSRIEGQAVGAARAVVDDLEPYLTAETVPRVVDALVPHLIEKVVPQVVDGVTEHLVTTTVPQIVEGITPQLADELVPVLLERLRPYLESELVPALVEGLTPFLVETTAPQIVDGLMPKIRAEVVPVLLDDIVDDPRVRDLIREQSQGLLLDAVESFRQLLARGDDLVERVVRRVRFARPALVVEDGPLPAGRRRSHAGALSRLVALGIDVGLVAFVATQGLAAVLGVIGSVVDEVPTWLVAGSATVAAMLMPAYLALGWWVWGRTLGGAVAGFAVVRADGRRLGPLRALARAVGFLALAPVWTLGMLRSSVDPSRRGWLDLVFRTRTPYRVHEARQSTATTISAPLVDLATTDSGSSPTSTAV